jgi:4-hydroxybenzoate polyprenyltransferase/phosphoserine phosphatase
MLLQADLSAAEGALQEQNLPLCIDLDGTLLLSDSLLESVVAALGTEPLLLLRLPGWLGAGKARLKQELAAHWRFDPAHLPYNARLLEWLREQRAAGRRLVLCTAAHRSIAERIAVHLGLFDEVIATEGDDNLRGPAKAAALVQRFGERGFVYAGNDATDEVVWDAAAAAIVVNAAPALKARAAAKYRVLAVFDPPPGGLLRPLLRAMRPYQWVKNALCLVPLIAAVDFHDAGAWGRTLLLVAGFCLIASAIYIVNDLSDLAADRAHERKRRRPFASGALSIPVGMALTPVLLLAGGLCAALSGALLYVLLYAAASFGYSLWLKEQPLVDVFMLAFLYTIRLFGGGVASGHEVSLWLLGFSSFLFLSLALVKRVSELGRHAAKGTEGFIARRGYMVEDIAMLQMFGCAATFASVIVLSLYVQSDVVSAAYGNPQLLWGAIPLLLFWQCRLWLSTARGYMHDDPIVYAARDWVSWLVFGCLVLVVLAAWAPVGR